MNETNEKNENSNPEKKFAAEIEKLQSMQQAMQLFEKGLLSKSTLISLHGYDPDREIELLRFESLQMQHLGKGLGKEEIEKQSASLKALQINTLSSAIEATRRTLELLLKQYPGIELNSQVANEIVEYHKLIFKMTKKMAILLLSEEGHTVCSEELPAVIPGNG